jgi:hypothetical protein
VKYWFYAGIIWPIVLGSITSVWFTIGGIRDLRMLFYRLARLQLNANDDGEAMHEAVQPAGVAQQSAVPDPVPVSLR